jgi:hypothetical protein
VVVCSNRPKGTNGQGPSSHHRLKGAGGVWDGGYALVLGDKESGGYGCWATSAAAGIKAGFSDWLHLHVVGILATSPAAHQQHILKGGRGGYAFT